MQWMDDGIIVGRRKHGESSLIVEMFTKNHGVHAGLVRRSKKNANIYEIGNQVRVKWRARLPEHLGNYEAETIRNNSAILFNDYKRLMALSSCCALVRGAFPERETHTDSYQKLLEFLGGLSRDDWLAHYIRWEASFLTDLGFGLDFSKCAVTGATGGLTYVSPRTGRAVSAPAAAPYEEKLLPLPAFLVDNTPANDNQLTEGLALTGYFLERHVFMSHNKPVPKARERFVAALK